MSTVPVSSPTPTVWTPRRRRLLLAVTALLLAGIALTLVLRAFSDNIVLYLMPSDVAAGKAQGKDHLRIGGMVEAGSVRRGNGPELEVRFVLTDGAHSVPVLFRGKVLPDLFAEGKGAIAQGRLDAQGQLVASEVLAKHDENYTPPGMPHPAASQ
jgi:cytochrome c-type biogenesis protein CcmE